MYTLGTGELVERARRFLGLRGRIDLAMDQQLVPVVVGQDLAKAPFRKSGVRMWGGVDLLAAGANSAQVIVNHTPSIQVLDQLRVTNRDAAATLDVAVHLGLATPPGPAFVFPWYTGERRSQSVSGPQVGGFGWANPGAVGVTTLPSLFRTRLAPNAYFELRQLDLGLIPGGYIVITRVDAAGALMCYGMGWYWDDIERP